MPPFSCGRDIYINRVLYQILLAGMKKLWMCGQQRSMTRVGDIEVQSIS